MKKIVAINLLLAALTAGAVADNLYKVTVANQADAVRLTLSGVSPIYRIADGYLVLADQQAADQLTGSGLKSVLLATGVNANHLAVDNRLDRVNVSLYRLLYEENQLRIYDINQSAKSLAAADAGLAPLSDLPLTISYRQPTKFNPHLVLGPANLDSLIDLVSQDSCQAYDSRLQAFYRRYTGTDSCNAARDWIASKFLSFGYDSVLIDTFTWSSGTGYNVVAVKPGSRYPGQQIVIGAHYDAVAVSPGADDNGSGSSGVLEVARILKNIPTEMTIIFVTFDTEEQGLYGSSHYAATAQTRGDSIIYMLNMDMIAHQNNSTLAKLYYGTEISYSQLWGHLADSLVGITGVLSGSSGSSDHAPFAQRGFDVTFAMEYNMSTHYHSTSDSTTYLNFEYMSRMVKASLATAYVVNLAPPPVRILSIRQVGDGQSLQIIWQPGDPSRTTHYWLHYNTVPATQPESLLVPTDSSHYIVTGLTPGQQYAFYLIAYDIDGRSSLAFDEATGTPLSLPAAPQNLTAMPEVGAINLTWRKNNNELDFDHYVLIRDNTLLPATITDTFYTDNSGSLGSSLHSYLVRAVDKSANQSDTAGMTPAVSKAATLGQGKILAVNRSATNLAASVDEVVTGEFIRDALQGLNFTYFSDTAYAVDADHVNLLNMVDYELVVVGGESGRAQDDIGLTPILGGILNDLTYYMSLGGKVILFGRWGGNVTTTFNRVDTAFYYPNADDYGYTQYFHTAYRVRPLSVLVSSPPSTNLMSDLVGAHSHNANYPDLVWDSTATLAHTGSPFTGITGIPYISLPVLTGGPLDTLYTYNSSSDSLLTEGKPMAWRYRGDYQYVFFNLPLSFMQRPNAKAALRQAVADMGLTVAVDDNHNGEPLPRNFELAQNYPNPFNPTTTIEFYNPKSKTIPVTIDLFNIMGQKVRTLLDGPALPGKNQVIWDGRDGLGQPVATGIYFYRLKTAEVTLTKKMLLMK
jgi:hypothetical protein